MLNAKLISVNVGFMYAESREVLPEGREGGVRKPPTYTSSVTAVNIKKSKSTVSFKV